MDYFKISIKLKQQISLFLLIIVISSTTNDIFPQNTSKKPTRQSSLETFSKGNYEEAFNEFQNLLITYPKDPLYKYYSGVCLVKLNKDPEKAVTLLSQALQSASAIKQLPSDVSFYLGRAQQMEGNYSEALISFDKYTEVAGKSASRELGVPEFINQCRQETGKIVDIDVKPDDILLNDIVDPARIYADKEEVVVPQKQENVETVPKTALKEEYDMVLDEAIQSQFMADSISDLILQQKKEIDKLPVAEAVVLKEKISENELLAASFQKLADQKYQEANAAMNPQQQKPEQIEPLQQSEVKFIKDTISKPDIHNIVVSNQKEDKELVKETDKRSDISQMAAPLDEKNYEIYSYFEVLEKPVTDPSEKIIIDGEVPAGLIYRIQTAVFRNPVAPAYFKGIKPIYGFRIPGNDKTIYYCGLFRRISDANRALTRVKTKGFKDAFVVALLESKRISSDRAVLLEKEWGHKSFVSIDKSLKEKELDTVPPTLSFRVEVLRSVKPLKDDSLGEIRKMAGTRGLDILPLNDGNIAYLVGKFITFESAAEYTDLLVRNGYREAKVVAFLGKREIPVETAKQLFDSLE